MTFLLLHAGLDVRVRRERLGDGVGEERVQEGSLLLRRSSCQADQHYGQVHLLKIVKQQMQRVINAAR